MTRDAWISDFVDEIAKLRPHLAGRKVAHTLGYDPKQHPRDLARQYDRSLRPASPAPAKKRPE